MRKDCSAGRGLLTLSETIIFSRRPVRLSTKKNWINGYFGFIYWSDSAGADKTLAHPGINRFVKRNRKVPMHARLLECPSTYLPPNKGVVVLSSARRLLVGSG